MNILYIKLMPENSDYRKTNNLYRVEVHLTNGTIIVPFRVETKQTDNGNIIYQSDYGAYFSDQNAIKQAAIHKVSKRRDD